MAQIRVKVRNNRTGREYFVSEEGWDNIVKQGWDGRFTILDKRQLVEANTPSYLPPEIGQAAEAAAKALSAGDQLGKPSGGSQASPIND